MLKVFLDRLDILTGIEFKKLRISRPIVTKLMILESLL